MTTVPYGTLLSLPVLPPFECTDYGVPKSLIGHDTKVLLMSLVLGYEGKKIRQSAAQFAFFTESLFFFFFACLAAVDGQPLYLIQLEQSFSFNPLIQPKKRAGSQMPNATLPLISC